MIDSTGIVSSLTGTEICKYYSIFLNTMSSILHNFGAKIIKNAGDGLIFYFPKTLDINNKLAFQDVLECGPGITSHVMEVIVIGWLAQKIVTPVPGGKDKVARTSNIGLSPS
ncbi:MAG: hypothetical protein WA364_20690 [Candidatus Nitrosopolaris sp.]